MQALRTFSIASFFELKAESRYLGNGFDVETKSAIVDALFLHESIVLTIHRMTLSDSAEIDVRSKTTNIAFS